MTKKWKRMQFFLNKNTNIPGLVIRSIYAHKIFLSRSGRINWQIKCCTYHFSVPSLTCPSHPLRPSPVQRGANTAKNLFSSRKVWNSVPVKKTEMMKPNTVPNSKVSAKFSHISDVDNIFLWNTLVGRNANPFPIYKKKLVTQTLFIPYTGLQTQVGIESESKYVLSQILRK